MVTEVRMPRLATYERKPYFWTDGAATGVVFRAPVNGATTPNSQNPRSELRQMNANGDEASWSNKNQTWLMTARLKVTKWPTSGDNTRGVVLMQIHDGNDDVTVLRSERSGELWVTKGDNTHHDKIMDPYPLGKIITVRVLAAAGGGIYWYLNNLSVPVASVGGVYSGAYFKAGCYTQGNESNSTGYGESVFYSLEVRKA